MAENEFQSFFFGLGGVMAFLLTLAFISTFFINRFAPNPIQDIGTWRVLLGISIGLSLFSMFVNRNTQT